MKSFPFRSRRLSDSAVILYNMADAREDIFEVFDSGELKGRGLRALKSLAPGDKVLESTPSVYVLSNSVRGQCCDFCFAKSEDLQRCSKCKFARYCNRECQKNAWKDHKTECERILSVSPNIPTDLVRLMARIMQQQQLQAGKMSSIYRAFLSHQKEFDDERKEAFSAIVTVLQQFVGERDFKKSYSGELFNLFGKISCNSFTICDAELQPLGVGIYQIPSLFNHSCVPNCVAIFNGTKLLIYATEQIKKGDELTISYTELLCPSYQRKEDLKNRYMFECSCSKCLSPLEEDGLMLSLQCSDFSCNGAVPRDLSSGGFAVCNACGRGLSDKTVTSKAQAIISKSEETLKQIKALEKIGNYEAVLDSAENILAEQKGFFHKLHFSRVHILDKAMDACIYLELWHKALAFGLQTMDAYKLFYPRCHPSVGIQLFRIGKLQIYLDKLKEGFQTLLQAEAILKVTHGNHPLVQELRELIAQTLEELRVEQNRTFQGLELL